MIVGFRRLGLQIKRNISLSYLKPPSRRLCIEISNSPSASVHVLLPLHVSISKFHNHAENWPTVPFLWALIGRLSLQEIIKIQSKETPAVELKISILLMLRKTGAAPATVNITGSYGYEFCFLDPNRISCCFGDAPPLVQLNSPKNCVKKLLPAKKTSVLKCWNDVITNKLCYCRCGHPCR